MRDELPVFIAQVPKWQEKSASGLIDYFLYFLTIVRGQEYVTASNVAECFDVLRLKRYSNISAYLSRYSSRKRGSRPRFLRVKSGYQLERKYEETLGKTLQAGPAKTETTHALKDLLGQLAGRNEKEFLQEAIDCYEIDARRAAIVMVWILTVHHLYQYILKHKITAFNKELKKVTDRRVKVKVISTIDDFSEMPESVFIQIMRSASIISNDVRKILDTKLGIRNSYAHPSALLISQVKTTDFIIDLTQNVILKYKV